MAAAVFIGSGAVQPGLAKTVAREAPDAIFFGGKILTVDPKFSVRQAFAVKQGQFVAVGSDETIRRLAGPYTRRVDLKGATVIPGMADSHSHLLTVSQYWRGLDLTMLASKTEIVAHLVQPLRSAKPHEVIYGDISWREGLPGSESAASPLTRMDIDPLSYTNPIILYRGRLGPALLNTVALRRLGITREHPMYAGLPVPVDANGEPTGRMELPVPVRSFPSMELEDPTDEDAADQRLIGRQRELNALGITSIRDLSELADWIPIYERLYHKRQLTVRVSMGLWAGGSQDPAIYAWRQRAKIGGYGDAWLKLDTLGEGPQYDTSVKLSEAEHIEVAREANRLGWRMSPHVTGGNIEAVLTAFDAANAENPILGKRWVVEHVNNLTPEEMDRFAKMGVIVSIQDYTSSPFGRMSPAVAARRWPVRELLAHGLMVMAGSDTLGYKGSLEISSDNPFAWIHTYVTGHQPDGSIAPDETISRADALRLVTINCAYGTFDEKSRGSIERGKLADFVILSEDYLTVPEEELAHIQPVATYVEGVKVFDRRQPDTGNTFPMMAYLPRGTN